MDLCSETVWTVTIIFIHNEQECSAEFVFLSHVDHFKMKISKSNDYLNIELSDVLF